MCEDLLSSVDQPLKVAKDKSVGKNYLLCDYNRDGDSYRYVQIYGKCALSFIRQVPWLTFAWGEVTEAGD